MWYAKSASHEWGILETLHIITHRRIVEFAMLHPNAASALDSWYRAMKSGGFHTIAELKAVFPSADLIRKDVFVFNVGGNTARLVASVDFVRQRVYILAILTHASYDMNKWK
jgi:mRNA interferase HigB